MLVWPSYVDAHDALWRIWPALVMGTTGQVVKRPGGFGIHVAVTDPALVSYEYRGQRWVASGSAAAVIATLRTAGYSVVGAPL